MGLLGLATFSAEQRTKEIGIRKVFGAAAESIVMLISTDFIRLLAISAAIALPLAYYVMSGWLEGFAYRYEIGPGTFVFSSLLALVIAMLTVGSQALRAAIHSPLASLKYE